VVHHSCDQEKLFEFLSEECSNVVVPEEDEEQSLEMFAVSWCMHLSPLLSLNSPAQWLEMSHRDHSSSRGMEK
jgi:hypothetical protein